VLASAPRTLFLPLATAEKAFLQSGTRDESPATVQVVLALLWRVERGRLERTYEIGTVTAVEAPTLLVTVTVTDSIAWMGCVAEDDESLLVRVKGT